jgi:hypothetical protein
MMFATYIITNGLKNASLAKAEDGTFPGLAGMFKTALIAKTGNDNSPITAWVSSGLMSEEEVAYLNSVLPGPFEFSTGEYEDQGQVVKEDGHSFIARKNYRMKPDVV